MDFTRVTDLLALKEAEPVSGEQSVVSDLVAPKDMVAQLNALRLENEQLKTRIVDLEKAADTDPLLPIYNRRAFVREIDRARNMMGRYDILSSLIYFDLNNFKIINDQHGHAVGDDVLRMVSDVLKGGVRDCDLVARLGGDEFGVLLFKISQAEARSKAHNLAKIISERAIVISTGHTVRIETAWGLASCQAEDSADQILARADRAMYLAKYRAA